MNAKLPFCHLSLSFLKLFPHTYQCYNSDVTNEIGFRTKSILLKLHFNKISALSKASFDKKSKGDHPRKNINKKSNSLMDFHKKGAN